MKQLASLRTAIIDSELLGAALGSLETFRLWVSVIFAAFAEPLSPEELELFNAIAGGRKLPAKRVRELWVIAGRRGGKSRIAALLAVYIALCFDHSEKLAAGEIGYVLVLAPSRDQAKTVFGYCLGFLESSPVFSKQIEEVTAEEIRLRNNVIISISAANFRTVRGKTILAAICDESAFWRDESSAQPDIEIIRALLPSIIASSGLIVGISSAYRRAGLIYQKFRDFYGVDDEDILVVRGTSLQFNPTLNEALIEKAYADDEESARAEWGSEFRSDLSQFLDDALIDAAIRENGPLEIRPDDKKEYFCFVDGSSGRHDAYSMAIGHREDHKIIADVVRRKNSPFDPAVTTSLFAELAKDYAIKNVVGDNWAPGWMNTAWEAEGIHYTKSEKPKSQLYLDGLAAFTRGQIEIPNDPTLIRELRILERRTSRSGRDSVSDPAGNTTYDDSANALFGLIHLLREQRKQEPIYFGHYKLAS